MLKTMSDIDIMNELGGVDSGEMAKTIFQRHMDEA